MNELIDETEQQRLIAYCYSLFSLEYMQKAKRYLRKYLRSAPMLIEQSKKLVDGGHLEKHSEMAKIQIGIFDMKIKGIKTGVMEKYVNEKVKEFNNLQQ